MFNLIKGPTNSGSNNESQTKECLETGEGRGYIIRKFLGNNSKASRKKSCVSKCLDYTNDERQDDEGVVALDFVEHSKEDSARSSR